MMSRTGHHEDDETSEDQEDAPETVSDEPLHAPPVPAEASDDDEEATQADEQTPAPEDEPGQARETEAPEPGPPTPPVGPGDGFGRIGVDVGPEADDEIDEIEIETIETPAPRLEADEVPDELPYSEPDSLDPDVDPAEVEELTAQDNNGRERGPVEELDEIDELQAEGIEELQELESLDDADLADAEVSDGPEEAELEAMEEPDAPPEAAAEPLEPADTEPADGEGQGPAAKEPGPPLRSDADTRQLIKSMKKQQKVRAQQEVAEAKALEERAKALKKKAEERRKMEKELEVHTEKVEHLAPELGFDPERPVTEIPELGAEHLTQTEFSTIEEGRSYVRIVFDSSDNRYIYQVIEPQLSQTEAEVLDFLRDTLIRTLEARPGLDAEDLETYLAEQIDRAILDHSILVDEVSRERLKYYTVRDFLGYGPIDVLMQDPMIEDISCDGPGIPVYLFHRQYESIRTNVTFEDDYELDSFVIRLAQRSGKHISIAEPMLDATLPDTSRLQATLSREVTTRGSSFTIRKFRSDPLTPPDLVRLGTMSAEMCAWYWLAMEEGSSMIYAGGTASGKTTSLNAICQFIPPDRKVVSIEDTREINMIHENWIAGLTRSGFGGDTAGGKQAGEVDMFRLLSAALRQRPEYLLVGEVRGPEAKTLFQAMATGHATYSTMHADSVKSAVYRLENPPIDVPRIMLQTLESISVQTQVRINQRMVRRVRDVTEIIGIDPETRDILTNTVFKWDPSRDEHRFYGKSQVLEHIAEKNNLTMQEVMRELENRTRVVRWMVEKGIRHITDVSDVLGTYYAKPDVLLDRIDAEGNQGLKMALKDHGDDLPEAETAELTGGDEPRA